MKNEDITESEINSITQKSAPREQAFFTIMRQSGLTPQAIKQLRIGDVERILEPNPPIPCRIRASHEKSLTFIGNEAVNYLRRYLRTRENLTPQSLLFTKRNNPSKEINTKAVSRAFKLAARKTTHQTGTGRSNELKLYSLISFYRKRAKGYETELGKYNTPKSAELCREVYRERAMPFLEIELPTPTEIHRLMKHQQELEAKLRRIEDLFPKLKRTEDSPEYWEAYKKDQEQTEKLIEEYERHEKWLKEHPEEQKRLEEQRKKQQEENQKWLEDHPEEAKQIEEQMDAEAEWAERIYRERLEERVKDFENRLKELEEIIKKPTETQRKRTLKLKA